MRPSPIPYVKDAKLRGTLFDPQDSTGIVCGVDTQFYLDHEEPMKALRMVQEFCNWPLGSLPEGHEYLVIVPSKYIRPRARYLSKPANRFFNKSSSSCDAYRSRLSNHMSYLCLQENESNFTPASTSTVDNLDRGHYLRSPFTSISVCQWH